jgi:hypothetical protein
MKIRRIFAALLAAVMIAAVSGCGQTENAAAELSRATENSESFEPITSEDLEAETSEISESETLNISGDKASNFIFDGDELIGYTGDSEIVNIPDGTIEIGDYITPFGKEPVDNRPFVGNHMIKQINFPATIQDGELNGIISGTIDCDFWDMPNLEAITIDENNPYYKSVDGVLYRKPDDYYDHMQLIWYPQNKPDRVYNIPENVTFRHANNGIINNYNLEIINIPADFPAFYNEKGQNYLYFDNYGKVEYTPALKAYEVNPNNPNYKTINGVLYGRSDDLTIPGWYIVDYPTAKEGETYIVPPGVVGTMHTTFDKDFKYLKNVVWEKVFTESDPFISLRYFPKQNPPFIAANLNFYVPKDSQLYNIISFDDNATGKVIDIGELYAKP